jgi:hypothetical protein
MSEEQSTAGRTTETSYKAELTAQREGSPMSSVTTSVSDGNYRLHANKQGTSATLFGSNGGSLTQITVFGKPPYGLTVTKPGVHVDNWYIQEKGGQLNVSIGSELDILGRCTCILELTSGRSILPGVSGER